MQGFCHHIDLTVGDPATAWPLYHLFLTHAGFTKTRHDNDAVEWGMGSRRYPSLGIRRATGVYAARPHDRYSPGLHHLALAAASREAVDELHAKLAEAGAQILDAPADYPEYGEGYYALFFADADGLKLEYVYTPEPQQVLEAIP